MAIVDINGRKITAAYPQLNPMEYPIGGDDYVATVNEWIVKWECTPDIFEMIASALVGTPPRIIELILQESYHKRKLATVTEEITKIHKRMEAKAAKALA